jgi:putative phosphoribosyl transferase
VRAFRNRRDAGRRLALALASLRDDEPVVVGLPRGGVPVAAEVAEALGAPLDVIVVRKLGVPFQPELGMGAIGEGGVRVLNDEVVRIAGVSPGEVAEVEARERFELERRAQRFRGDRTAVPLAGRTVIVVDDGIATGGTARAAVEVARAHGASRVVLAVPVAPPDTVASMREIADEVVCLATPVAFSAVGQWYEDFTQTSDAEVVRLLDANAAASDPALTDVLIPVGDVELAGRLAVPAAASGVVVFAHGSGSSRHSPRNRYVAQALQDEGLATLLFDLLTPEEELHRHNVFDVELLGRRLGLVTEWLGEQPTTQRLSTGCFGASTGAAAALWAAAAPGSRVRAVVSRGGRPDLAGPRLAAVQAPTLLIVGGRDDAVLELNREAAASLRCEHRIEVVPGATHLFEEPGTLEAAARLAADWFLDHL